MSTDGPPLYGQDEAQALQRQEASRGRGDQKLALLLEHLGPCRRLVDIGCGWGQFLQLAQERVAEVWGVDESPDRLRDIERACPRARAVICRADRLALPGAYFDVAVMSQMLHEVKLFGRAGELPAVLGEVRRILVGGGRYLLLDHLDAGPGEVVVRLPAARLHYLAQFERRYRYYPAGHALLGEGRIRLSRRCLQDFLTKEWSLSTAMEAMEMGETHNVFEQGDITRLVEVAGLAAREWLPFADIRDDLAQAGGELIEGEPWRRKFLLVAHKR